MARLANALRGINTPRRILALELGGGTACVLIWVAGYIAGHMKPPPDFAMVMLRNFGADCASVPVAVFIAGLLMLGGRRVPWQKLRALIQWWPWPYIAATGALLFGYGYEAYQATEGAADWRDPFAETAAWLVAILVLRLIVSLERSRAPQAA